MLVKALRENQYLNIELNNRLTGKMDPREQQLVRELVLGVSSRKIYLEKVLAHYLHEPISRTKLEMRVLLMIGAYQILFMPWIPTHAAVHESVDMAKSRRHLSYGAKMVNAILRKLVAERQQWLSLDKMSFSDQSAFFGFPEWIAFLWRAQYGEENALEIMKAMNEQRGVGIRVNKRITDSKSVLNELHANQFQLHKLQYSHSGYHVEQSREITETEGYKNGAFSIQDESAMLVGDLTNPRPGSRILDLCAAPGGKSFHLAENCPTCRILSNDLYEKKVKRMIREAKRLHLNNCSFSVSNAEEFQPDWDNKFDYCLVDAPCSALGLIGRKPEIKELRKPADLDEIAETQRRILRQAARYVKPGGILVYSTCTLNKKENEKQIDWFCKNFRFTPVPLGNPIPSKRLETEDQPGRITLFPHIDQTNGFFIAVVRKEEP